MFDTRSTSDSLSPDFTRVAGIKVFTLVKPNLVQWRVALKSTSEHLQK